MENEIKPAVSDTYMARAIELASLARGRTSPNPMVGAVIVRNGSIAGEGYHLRAGEDHAEVAALSKAGAQARGADMYVNLEPCAHFGRTPPCVNAISEAGIARVFAAVEDPNPRVSGQGVEQLRRSGIEVHVGLLEKEARELNESYFKYITTGKPFVFLKTGMSLDGKTATRTRDSRWITSDPSRRRVHQLRDEVDAIMVGIGTVLADDPELTTRLPGTDSKNPDRVILDSLLRIPLKARVLTPDEKTRILVVTTSHAPEERIMRLRGMGVEVLIMEEKNKKIDMSSLMLEFGRKGTTSLLIEGGGEVAASALAHGIVDKVIYFIAPKIIGGRKAPTPVGGEGVDLVRDAVSLRGVKYTPIGDDLMVEGYLNSGRD